MNSKLRIICTKPGVMIIILLGIILIWLGSICVSTLEISAFEKKANSLRVGMKSKELSEIMGNPQYKERVTTRLPVSSSLIRKNKFFVKYSYLLAPLGYTADSVVSGVFLDQSEEEIVFIGLGWMHYDINSIFYFRKRDIAIYAGILVSIMVLVRVWCHASVVVKRVDRQG
jgi:hypothetical protein